jgi:butyryl-CoA:acetate CoA-transferase
VRNALKIRNKGTAGMGKAHWNEYRNKLRTAEEAAGIVKSGDWVYYSHFAMMPVTLDEALAARAGEMTDVKVATSCGMYPARVATEDPQRKTFSYHSSFLSAHERKLGDRGLCFYIPSNYHEAPWRLRNGFYPRPNVAMIKTTAMDENGLFNFGPASSYVGAIAEMAETIIVEVNASVPKCLGGHGENIHISRVDYIVEGETAPIMTIAKPQPTEEDKKIASLIIEEIRNGACLQLGIGGIPNAVGGLIAGSDLVDLGVHSEMMCDAFMDLYADGKITGRFKHTDKNKMVYTFALGTKKLYEFLDDNPACAIFPVDYTNRMEHIAGNDNVISINNALQVDLYGQAASEAFGKRQISGSGGQGDFIAGAAKSRGGKAFLCLRSTRTAGGKLVSRIVPDIQGIVTIPRASAFHVVTEYGKTCLKGKSTWAIAEGLISIAHPDFRDGLARDAESKGIWRRSNKIG